MSEIEFRNYIRDIRNNAEAIMILRSRIKECEKKIEALEKKK